jgi:hypothetical protein
MYKHNCIFEYALYTNCMKIFIHVAVPGLGGNVTGIYTYIYYMNIYV